MDKTIGAGIATSIQAASFVLNCTELSSLSTSKNEMTETKRAVNSSDTSSGIDASRKTSGTCIKPPTITVNNTPMPVRSKASQKFQKLFNLDENECLVKSFACALVDEILFQGTFYASNKYFCFHAKIAKKRKLMKVAIADVTKITREKTAGIIPNAIAVHNKTDRYLFTSFISRDTTFRCLNQLMDTQRSTNAEELDLVSHDSMESSHDDESGATGTEHRRFSVNSSSASGPTHSKEELRKVDGSLAVLKKYPRQDSMRGVSKKTTRSGSQHRREHTDENADLGLTFAIYGYISELWNLQRQQLFLSAAYIVLIFLSISAVVMAWRVHTFQLLIMERIQTFEALSNPLLNLNSGLRNPVEPGIYQKLLSFLCDTR